MNVVVVVVVVVVFVRLERCDYPGAAPTPRSRVALPLVTRRLTGGTPQLCAAILQLHVGSFQSETKAVILRDCGGGLQEASHILLLVDDGLKFCDRVRGDGFWVVVMLALTVHVGYVPEVKTAVASCLQHKLVKFAFEASLVNQVHHDVHLDPMFAQEISLDGVACASTFPSFTPAAATPKRHGGFASTQPPNDIEPKVSVMF